MAFLKGREMVYNPFESGMFSSSPHDEVEYFHELHMMIQTNQPHQNFMKKHQYQKLQLTFYQKTRKQEDQLKEDKY